MKEAQNLKGCMGSEVEKMRIYIPNFWCGFIAGVIVATVAIIAIAIYSGKNKEESEEKQSD